MADDKKVIFSMTGVSKTYKSANKTVLKNIYLSFFYGAKIGILGLNGSGKSTLLKIIAGLDQEFQGDVVFSKDYSVGYLEQDPKLDESKTVIDIVKEGAADTIAILDEYNKINDMFGLEEVYSDADKMEKLMNRQAVLQDEIDAKNAWELDTKLEIAMDALRTPAGDTPIKNLSGGERRRVALCRLLLKEPDVLLLDEPTNHLDAESVLWLEHHLQEYKGTVIAVTHDRYFLDNVAGWILELDRGEGIPWKGNYSSWLDQKTTRMAKEEKQASKRRKTLERELEWVKMAPKGRHAKSKARLNNYDKLMSQEEKQKDANLELYIPNGPRLGTNVIDASDVSKGFDDKLLYENLNFNLPPNGIVGVIGPNGAGKTTLFKMIMGEEQPITGDFKVGETAKIAYVDQAHSNIDPEKTIYENFADGQEQVMMGGHMVNTRA
ncbi:MAG: energy-dependent translational throttle protein EttA, partial [Flavobacteriales bacterium]|nr:energy-dependent translational throttle protein EttA [Flavobacteriales bacterium]